MKYFLYLILGFIIIQGFNSGCKKKEKTPCLAPDTTYEGFNITEIGKVPYHGYDTLIFKNEESGIIYTFYGKGIDTSLIYYQRWFPDMCPEKFQKCKSELYRYESPTFPYPILLRAHVPVGDEDLAKLAINFDRVDYVNYLTALGNGGYSDTINGKIYHNINHIKVYGTNGTNFLKYNIYQGILQVKFEDKIYSRQQ
jgi:hypothetical protein